MAKKTLSTWLTNRYLLIIRNEENFAEKKTISFNYARAILIATAIFLVTLIFAIYLVTFTLKEWLDPRYVQMQTNRRLLELTERIDSMMIEMARKDQYLTNVRAIFSGDPDVFANLEEEGEQVPLTSKEIDIKEKLLPADSQFRAEFEQEDFSLSTYRTSNAEDFKELYLFSPLSGIVSDSYNPKEDHFGVDIVAKEGEPVKCVADGVVIFASWTLDSGYVIGVQHRSNLISMYKHNSELMKNVGNFVSGGDVIAIIGNTGELTSGPHLHFELWHNGSSVNPEEYIAF